MRGVVQKITPVVSAIIDGQCTIDGEVYFTNLATLDEIEVGITISTDDEKMRKIFEPGAPPIEARISTLRTLKEQGVRTHVFVGPMLPMNPEVLSEKIGPYADSILISRMNYVANTVHLFKKLGMMQWLDKSFAQEIKTRFRKRLGEKKVTDC